MPTVPATKITEPVWQGFNLYRQINLQGGQIVPFFTAVCAYQQVEFLGDANGNPVQAINQGVPGGNENISGPDQMAAAFGEIVTRADGTKIALHDLLEAVLMARANAWANPPVPTA